MPGLGDTQGHPTHSEGEGRRGEEEGRRIREVEAGREGGRKGIGRDRERYEGTEREEG